MDKYYVLKAAAVPEVLIKTVEVKQLLGSGKVSNIKEAVSQVGISRSSFYKYKDDIFPFDDHAKGRTVSLSIDMDDVPGSLSKILQVVADARANILTIHQSIPVQGLAIASLSIETGEESGSISEIVDNLNALDSIRAVKILGE